VMKWQPIHPRPGEYSFEAADRFVEFGEKNDMFIIGHTLVWHSQTPRWVFEDDDGKTWIQAIDPIAMFSVVGRGDISPIADDVKARLVRVLEKV